MSALLDRLIPEAGVRGRHETTVRAPVAFVYEVARALDIRSVPAVRAIPGWAPRGVGAPITTRAIVLREPEPGRTRLLVRVRVAAAFRPLGPPPGPQPPPPTGR